MSNLVRSSRLAPVETNFLLPVNSPEGGIEVYTHPVHEALPARLKALGEYILEEWNYFPQFVFREICLAPIS